MLKLGQITKLQNNIVNIGLDSNFIFTPQQLMFYL